MGEKVKMEKKFRKKSQIMRIMYLGLFTQYNNNGLRPKRTVDNSPQPPVTTEKCVSPDSFQVAAGESVESQELQHKTFNC